MLDGPGGMRQGEALMHTLYRPEASRALEPRGYQLGPSSSVSIQPLQPLQPPQQPNQPRLFGIPPNNPPQPYRTIAQPPIYQQPMGGNIFSTEIIR